MKTKEIIVCVIALLILLFTVNTVYASGNSINLEDLDLTSSTENNNQLNNITPLNSANNMTADKDSGLPDTGISNSLIIMIAICGTFAAYGYKKVKEYNIND